jgi:hypothetical protein
VFVDAANVADVKAAPVVLIPILETYNRINKILADHAYRGSLVEALDLAYNCTLEITKKLGDGFVVAPWRCKVVKPLLGLKMPDAFVEPTKNCPSIMKALYMLP